MRSLFSQFFVRHLAVLYGDGLVVDLEGRPLDFAHDLVVGVVHGVQIHLGLLVLKLVPCPKVLGVSQTMLLVSCALQVDDPDGLVLA